MVEPEVGQRLGKYQITGRLGQGGMASVYKAYDPTLQRYVAIKVLSPRLAAEEQVLRRFQLEATTAANLKHPNIVVIHDVGSAEGFYFLVMELLEGHTLREEIRTQGALPPPTHRVHHLAACQRPGLCSSARPDPPRCQAQQRHLDLQRSRDAD